MLATTSRLLARWPPRELEELVLGACDGVPDFPPAAAGGIGGAWAPSGLAGAGVPGATAAEGAAGAAGPVAGTCGDDVPGFMLLGGVVPASLPPMARDDSGSCVRHWQRPHIGQRLSRLARRLVGPLSRPARWRGYTCGFCVCNVAAFCATEGGSAGPIGAASGQALPAGPAGAGALACTGGCTVVVCPLRFVTVTVSTRC